MKGLKNPQELLEEINWWYDERYQGKELAEKVSNGIKRIVFRNSLSKNALDWYSTFDSAITEDWSKLHVNSLTFSAGNFSLQT